MAKSRQVGLLVVCAFLGALVGSQAAVAGTGQSGSWGPGQFDRWELYRHGSAVVVIKKTGRTFRIAEGFGDGHASLSRCFKGRISGSGQYSVHGQRWNATNGDGPAVLKASARVVGSTPPGTMFVDFKSPGGVYWRTADGNSARLASTGKSVKRLWYRDCVRYFRSDGKGPWQS